MRIRPAEYADLPDLRRMYRALCDEQASITVYPAMPTAEDIDSMTLAFAGWVEDPRWGIFVADVEGLVVGFVGGDVGVRAIGQPRRYGNAHWLYVMPAARKRGVAQRLITAGIEWCQQQGLGHVECFGLEGDDGWARRGFTPFLRRYFVPLEQLAQAPTAETPAPTRPTKTVPRKVNGRRHRRRRPEDDTDAARL